ncbi:YihY/virulence factor BrkB family protein [Planctomycetaceae bacterium SH139]
MFKRYIQYLIDTVRRPRAELTRRQQQLRYSGELVAHCWRVLLRHRAEGMAAELTYRTIFSLIPLVVLGLVTFRVFGGLEEIETRVADQMYSFFGVPDVTNDAYSSLEVTELEPPEPNSVSPAGDRADEADVAEEADEAFAGQPPLVEGINDQLMPQEQNPTVDSTAERQQVQASIRWALRELTQKVSTVDFASIGVVGLLLFIYAAIALADSVESVFNLIYSAPSGRPIHLRVAIHWSIITLGSALLAMSLYLSAQLVDYVSSATGWSTTAYINHALALLSGWVLLFLLYALMPNTRVSLPAAVFGSFVAAALWEFAKFGFQVYVSKAVPYSALYGSLGLIPLFLFWVYLTWFIILFGLVWTYTLQTAPGYVPTKEEDDIADELMPGDPQWLLLVMIELATAYQQGEALGREQLRLRLKLPTRVIQPMIEILERAHFLRPVDSQQSSQYVPSRPADQIMAMDVLRAGRFEPQSRHSRGWEALRALRRHDESRLADKTLADLIAP